MPTNVPQFARNGGKPKPPGMNSVAIQIDPVLGGDCGGVVAPAGDAVAAERLVAREVVGRPRAGSREVDVPAPFTASIRV